MLNRNNDHRQIRQISNLSKVVDHAPSLTVSSQVKNKDLIFKKWSSQDTVIIVGNGPSASGFKAPKDLPIIAVNGAAQWLNRYDYFFTLDQSKKNLDLLNQSSKNKTIKAVIAVPDIAVTTYQQEYPDAYVMTRMINIGHEPLPTGTPEWWAWRWGSVLGLADQEGAINTGNSAYGALGLAYHAGFKVAVLVGVDGTQEAGIDGEAPKDLSHLPILFKSAQKQIHIINCGKLSGFDQIPFTQWYSKRK